MIFSAVIAGFFSGAALIIAIGAQNAFVLRQGIRREHVLPIVAVCALSDAILIALGVAGIGTLVTAAPLILEIIRWAGVLFLVGYAIVAARRAIRPNALVVGGSDAISRTAAIATVLALTWLNPHVYLDTVLLMGTAASAQAPAVRPIFASGAATASFTWFAALGYGARLLKPVFARPMAWRVLDAFVGIVMLTLAASLLMHALPGL